jgi:hypothetical protein
VGATGRVGRADGGGEQLPQLANGGVEGGLWAARPAVEATVAGAVRTH